MRRHFAVTRPLAQRTSRAALLSSLLLAASLITACGGGAGDADDDKTITIAVAGSATIFSPPFLALQRGYFEDEGVTVKIIENAGANAVPLVASGQADLAYGGVAQSLALAQGKPASVILAAIGGFSPATVVAPSSIESIEDLAGKRIGTPGAGTTCDGYAHAYNDRLGLDADIVPFGTVATMAGALKSGQVDAAVCNATSFAELIDDGTVSVILEPGDPLMSETLGTTPYPEGAVFGLKETVDEKRDAMVNVVRALLRVNADLEASDASEGAETLTDVKAFSGFSRELLEKNLTYDADFIFPAEGEISEEAWAEGLEAYQAWGVLKGSGPPDSVSYENLIDMSVLSDAKAEE